ncbi:DNA cytosine methyltransferase [Janthinobacterium sp. RB2R34]|uniref:DNA cytosine methyltransferase n=1 Tax=Janthinobacterium sp. RB2R34 TaxID=3424193 RepID=UPI003F1EF728
MNSEVLEQFAYANDRVTRTLRIGDGVWNSSVANVAGSDRPPASAWWQSFLRGGAVYNDAPPSDAPIRIVDAFCGCGGLTLGATQAAIAVGRRLEAVAAIDVDGEGLLVHQKNFGTKHLLHTNASSIVDWHVSGSGTDSRFAYEPEILDPDLAGEVGKIDLFLAGPPCQGHSNLNNKTRREDPRNLLYITAVAIGVGLRARAIVLENVPEVVNDKSDVVNTAKTLLNAAGYKWIDSGVLAAHELGGAQTRKRYFLIACKNDADIGLSIKDVAKGLRNDSRSLEWAIGDLVRDDLSSGEGRGVMDTVPIFSEENVTRINHLFDNDLYDLPDEVRPDCHKNGHTYPSVYGRMKWDKPAQTITTGFLTPGRGRYIHPLVRRVLTPHEAARVQSFPDSFSFVVDEGSPPSRSSVTKWIGDAVPPLLGFAATLSAIARLR